MGGGDIRITAKRFLLVQGDRGSVHSIKIVGRNRKGSIFQEPLADERIKP